MPRKTTVPIYDGDDFETLNDLRKAVAIAERNVAVAERDAATSNPRAGDDAPEELVKARGELVAAKTEYNEFLDEASERATPWTLTTIGHAEFRELKGAHPPRKVTGEDGKERTHEDDEGVEVNTETFPLALMLYRDDEDEELRTVASPALELPALRRQLRRLSEGEFETLWSRAYALNAGGVADPKLDRFSIATTSSET